MVTRKKRFPSSTVRHHSDVDTCPKCKCNVRAERERAAVEERIKQSVGAPQWILDLNDSGEIDRQIEALNQTPEQRANVYRPFFLARRATSVANAAALLKKLAEGFVIVGTATEDDNAHPLVMADQESNESRLLILPHELDALWRKHHKHIMFGWVRWPGDWKVEPVYYHPENAAITKLLVAMPESDANKNNGLEKYITPKRIGRWTTLRVNFPNRPTDTVLVLSTYPSNDVALKAKKGVLHFDVVDRYGEQYTIRSTQVVSTEQIDMEDSIFDY